jgi:hypothetical protein
MCPTTPCKFLALSISHGDRVGRLDEAVPNLFEELQPIGNAKRLDLLANGAHGPILHVSVDCRKPHVSTDNAQAERPAKPVRSSLLFGDPHDATLSKTRSRGFGTSIEKKRSAV